MKASLAEFISLIFYYPLGELIYVYCLCFDSFNGLEDKFVFFFRVLCVSPLLVPLAAFDMNILLSV